MPFQRKHTHYEAAKIVDGWAQVRGILSQGQYAKQAGVSLSTFRRYLQRYDTGNKEC